MKGNVGHKDSKLFGSESQIYVFHSLYNYKPIIYVYINNIF